MRSLLLAVCLLTALPVMAQSGDDETPQTADSGETDLSQNENAEVRAPEDSQADPPVQAGPELNIAGVDLGITQSGEETPEATELDRFDDRTEQTKTLAQRAAAIVDATTVGGYGEHEFHWGPEETSTFINHRYIVFLYSQISDRISTATEIEFEFAGSPMKKDGVLGFGEVLLEFSVVDIELYEWLVFRAGVILVPVGAFNVRHDSPTRDLTERPIAYTTVVPTTWFESGMGFHGTVELPADMRLQYEAYLINGLDARISDGYALRGARGSHFKDNNSDKAFTGRVGFSPVLGMDFGVSGYTGAYDLKGNRVNIGALDATVRVGALELLGEFAAVQIDPGFVEGFAAGSVANTRSAVPEHMWGYYAQVNYHIHDDALWQSVFPDWLQESVFTAVLRYEGKDTDTARYSVAGDQRRLTLGFNFRPVEQVVIKNDWQFNSKGVEDVSAPAEFWNGDFWSGKNMRYVSSVAYLF